MRIVIGYDGTAGSDAALRDLESAGLPGQGQAAIVVAMPTPLSQNAFAVDPTGAGWLADAYVPLDPSPAELRKAEELGEHARLVARIKLPGWKIESEAVAGDPARALLEKAEDWKADLIVVGSHGWSWLGRVFLGSVAQKVLAHARVSVRLAQPRPGGPRGGPRILAAIDGSRDARLALDAIARRNWPAGAKVRLIAAKETFPWADALAAAETGKGRRLEPGSWEPMERVLEAAQSRLRAAGLEAEWEIQEGDPRSVILAEAESFRADCLFMGRRGLSGFNRLLIGSVSSAVAAHAPCSVEVIRRPIRIRSARKLIEKSARRRGQPAA